MMESTEREEAAFISGWKLIVWTALGVATMTTGCMIAGTYAFGRWVGAW